PPANDGRSFRSLQRELGHRLELVPVLAGGALGPRVHLGEFLGEDKAAVIFLPPGLILRHLAADFVVADALGPFVDALQIARLLAVHLNERNDYLQRLVRGPDQAQLFRALDVEAGSACEVDFVARVHTDDADVLAGGLRAVSRTAGDRHLHLGRRPRSPHELFDADAEPGRILRAEAAPFG